MKSVFLIGNGPSLNKIEVEKLKDKTTISFNRAYIAYEDWGFYPTYYMIIDPVVLENIKDKIKTLIKESGIKHFILPLSSKAFFGNDPKIIYVNYGKKLWPRGFYWGKSFNKMSIIANVGATSVPVLANLGFDQIVVLGTDCNYEEHDIKSVEIVVNENDKDRRIVYKSTGDHDPNHFRPDYFGKGTEYSKPQAGNHLKGWQFISQHFGKNGVEVLLCSPGSKLAPMFREVEFNKILAES